MRHFRRIGAFFSQNAIGYAKAIYVTMLLAWSLLTIWRVASGSLLETPDASPTLIKIDLLETVAFLAAWSLLLITLTTKIVNKGRDLEFEVYKNEEQLNRYLQEIKRHEETHPHIPDEVEAASKKLRAIEEQQEKIMKVTPGLIEETERVTQENKELREKLKADEPGQADGGD